MKLDFSWEGTDMEKREKVTDTGAYTQSLLPYNSLLMRLNIQFNNNLIIYKKNPVTQARAALLPS